MLDEAVLQELVEDVGRDVVADLLKSLQRTATGHMERAREAAEAGQYTEVHRPMHSLKSSAAGFGLTGTSRRAAELEARIKSGGVVTQAELGSLAALFRDEFTQAQRLVVAQATPAS